MDDIISTVRGDPEEFLKLAISLHNNLQFILEKINTEGNMAFLDIDKNMSSKSNIACHFYQKPTDIGLIFCICAPLQHKKNVNQGIVHSVLNATSNWLAFDQALKKNKTCWTKNQNTGEWYWKIVNQTLEMIRGVKDQLRTTPKEHEKSKTRCRDKPTIFFFIQRQPYSKLCKQIEESMRIASGFYNAKIKIIPPRPEIIFR